MPRLTLHAALVLAALLAPAPAVAQQVPSQAELQRLLRDPAAAQAIRQRLLASGMTPDQIRAQLQAAGYPASLLDQFMAGDLGALPAADASVVRAMAVLGLGTVDELRAFADSIRFAAERARATRAPEPEGLPLFGLDVFRRATTQFLPALAGPVDEGYRLGPGDVLVLILTGEVELAHTLEVTREGFVVIPQVGQVPVANLTMEQLRVLLRRRLAQSYSGIARGTTRFEVTVAQVRMVQVYVTGEVALPGSYQIPSVGTVLTALYQAGGPTARGNFRRVVVRRGRDTVAMLDLYDYLLEGAAEGDVRLQTGDVVFVPVHGPRVKVTGAVVRPAIYELRPGQTLADLVEVAGGFRPDAGLERVTVHRILPVAERGPGPAPRAAVDVELPRAPDGDPDGTALAAAGVLVPPLDLRDGDSVVVDSVPALGQTHYVEIAGMVQQPGRFPWREGMTLRDLVLLARGPRVGADLREAEIARMPEERREGQLADTIRVPMDSSYLMSRDSLGRYAGPPGVPFSAAGTAPEVTLAPYDQVTVFRQPDFELQRTVVITGEVQYPGTYALTHKEERVSDLVQRAGGLKPTAYADGARFHRALDDAGRVNVDLPRALARHESRFDIVLQPGDSLDVPEFSPVVRVEGAVNAPTSVLYRRGADLEYYIANAGGYARNADRGRVSVRYANGSAEVKGRFLFFSTAPVPRPGSRVSVPEVPEGEGVNVTQLLGTVAQILASTVAIIVVVAR